MDDSGTLTMSTKELNRLEILGRVLERRLTQAQAAEQLGLSVRQVERLCRKLRLGGRQGLVCRRNEADQVTGGPPKRFVSAPWHSRCRVTRTSVPTRDRGISNALWLIWRRGGPAQGRRPGVAWRVKFQCRPLLLIGIFQPERSRPIRLRR